MRVVHAHGLTKESAKATVDSHLTALISRFGDSVSSPIRRWQNDRMEFSFQAMGFNFLGTLEFTDVDVILDASLPLAVKLLGGEERIRAEATRWFDEILPD